MILGEKINIREMIINLSDRLMEMEDTLPIEEKINKNISYYILSWINQGWKEDENRRNE